MKLPLALACVVAVTIAVPLAAHQATSRQAPAWPSERPPRALPAHAVAFPPYEFRTLANGLQVIAVSHHEQPIVSVRLIVRAGAAEDPDRKPGVAALMSNLLDQGTTSKTAEKIADTIDSIGGVLGTGTAADLTYINALVMKDSLDVGLDLVSDLAQHPAFAPEEIERQRQQTLSSLKVSYDDPDFLATSVFNRLVYGPHPYGRPPSSTPEILPSLTRDDLLAFHRRWFGANNAILALVGDLTPEEAFAGAARAFGTWRQVDATPPPAAAPPPPARRLVIIDKPGAVQTEIRAGNIGISRRSGDFLALDLAVKVLGGEGANRLHRVLRSERGLTYGASADLNGLAQSGDIMAQTSTRSQTTGETLRLMVDECWKLTRDRVGERELEGAQDYLTGAFPSTIETPSQIALQVLNVVFYGLNPKDLQTYRDRVNVISVDDVQRAARQYLHPDKLSIVLVGDASAFVGQLAAAGFDKYERIPLADLDLASPDLRRPPDAAAPRLRPASYSVMSNQPRQDSAKPLIDRAITAKGGLARLMSITSIHVESTTTVRAAAGPASFPSQAWIQYPDRFRSDAEMPGGKVSQVYDAGRFWIQDPSGVHELPEAARSTIRASIQRDALSVLRNLAAGKLDAREIDSDNPKLAAVEVTGADMPPLTLFLDRQTGLIARVSYDVRDAGRTTEDFTDYRTVEGLKVAYHTVVTSTGSPSIVRDIRTFRVNVPIPARIFAEPR